MRLVARLVATLGFLSACGDLPHDNPHDPQTPTDNQAHATLVGQVSLEPAGATAPSTSAIHVSVAGHSWAADTDADGRYAISGVPVGIWTVQFTRSGWDDDAIAGISVTLDDGGKELELPTMRLHVSRGNVTGTVGLEAETAASGVTVTLQGGGLAAAPGARAAALDGFEVSALTDAAGNFLLSGVPVGTYALRASKVGFLDGSIGTVVVTASSVTVLEDLLLNIDPGAFAGQVLVAGAQSSGGVTVRASGVTLNGSPWESTTQNRPDGSFLFSGLPGGTYTVSFELAGYATVTTSAAVVPGAVTDLAPVTLEHDTGAAFGLARLEGQGDASGILVVLRPDLSTPPVASALTDTSGAWHIDAAPVGTYVIVYTRQPGWAQATGSMAVLSHRTQQAADVLLAAIPGTLRGRVLLEGVAAGALGSTTVRVEGTNLSTATLADGRWVLTGVGGGAQTVVFERTGFDVQRVQLVTVPAGDLTLSDATLAVSRGGLGGTFQLQGLSVHAGVVVSATGPSGTSATTVTDAAGAFTLSGLPVGTYTLTARRDPDWQPLVLPGAVVLAGTTATMPGSPGTLVPISTASLSGTILLERPADASGTTVSVTGQDFRGGTVSRTATTAVTGAWSLAGLLAGSYQIACSHAGHEPCSPLGVAVASGAAVALGSSTLPVSLGSIGGAVALSAGPASGFAVGSDFSGVVVTLTGADVPLPAAVTDAAGNYRFDGVPVSLSGGSYTLSASKPSFRAGASASVTVLANSTVTAPGMTLQLDPGTITGSVQFWDNAGNTNTANASAAGATVTAAGTAYNGVAWNAATLTAAGGTFSLGNLPQGSYSVTVAAAGRTCTALGLASVAQGTTVPLGSVRCTDALPPGAVTLGAVTPPAGAQAGYTSSTSVSVPISVAAVDPTTPTPNLRGYQLAVGLAPDWSSPTVVAAGAGALTFTIPANARSILWARAVDWVGNTGPTSSVEIVEDGIAPPQPTLTSPRAVVNATTSSVTITGSELDANFYGYQLCTGTVAAITACPAVPSCTFTASAANAVVTLTAGQKTCAYARAIDRAGNVSAASAPSPITSDLSAPTPPGFTPSYDPYQLTVRAPWVDFFVSAAATDQPGSGAAWAGIAYVDVDTGAGFTPLCPQAACQTLGAWSPCSVACACADARLLCDGTRFAGVRAPLSQGTSTTVAFRAVDLAGNVGAGVSQQVFAEATSDVIASASPIERNSSIRGSLVGYESFNQGLSDGMLLDLGPNRRADAADRRCKVASTPGSPVGAPVFPVSDRLVAYSANLSQVGILRPGIDGQWCTADDVSTVLASYGSGWVDGVVGSGETVAWARRIDNSHFNLMVREPGADGVLGTADDPAAITVASAEAAYRLLMGGRTIVLQACGITTVCPDYIWRVYNSNPADSFSSGVTTLDLPSAGYAFSVSSDGRELAWVQGSNLVLLAPGADGRYGTADDVTVQAPVLPGTSVSYVAVDGAHLTGTGSFGGGSVVVHWWAGPDGRWGTADDVMENLRPSSANRSSPSMQGGLLVFEEASDLHAFDLTNLRWEVAPGTSVASRLALDGSDTLFYSAGVLTARTIGGGETSRPWASVFASGGSDLLVVDATGVWDYTVDAAGRYFTSGAPPPRQQYASANPVDGVAVGGGKAMVVEKYWTGGSYGAGNYAARYHILDPGAGTLHGAVAVYDPLPSGTNGYWAMPPVITGAQAIYNCGSFVDLTVPVCVLGAGPDGRFNTSDDSAPAVLTHVPSGVQVQNPSIVASSSLMLYSDGATGLTYLRDPGPAGLYDQADDRERVVSPRRHFEGALAVSGQWAAWIDQSDAGGDQVFVVNGYDGTVSQVTNHYSQKSGITIDSHGRTYWVDDVMTPATVMVYVP